MDIPILIIVVKIRFFQNVVLTYRLRFHNTSSEAKFARFPYPARIVQCGTLAALLVPQFATIYIRYVETLVSSLQAIFGSVAGMTQYTLQHIQQSAILTLWWNMKTSSLWRFTALPRTNNPSLLNPNHVSSRHFIRRKCAPLANPASILDDAITFRSTPANLTGHTYQIFYIQY